MDKKNLKAKVQEQSLKRLHHRTILLIDEELKRIAKKFNIGKNQTIRFTSPIKVQQQDIYTCDDKMVNSVDVDGELITVFGEEYDLEYLSDKELIDLLEGLENITKKGQIKINKPFTYGVQF